MTNAKDEQTPTTQRLLIRNEASVEERLAQTGVRARGIFSEQNTPFESSLTFVLRNRIPAGEVNTLHVHADVEKVYYFLSGVAEVDCGPWTERVGPGDFLFFPAAIPHCIRSLGPDDLEFIVCAARTVSTPRGLAGA